MVLGELYCGILEQNAMEKWKGAIEEVLRSIYSLIFIFVIPPDPPLTSISSFLSVLLDIELICQKDQVIVFPV